MSRSIMQLCTRLAVRAVGLVLMVASGEDRADVVAVVSVKSRITTLSKSQVADIFLGRSTRFPDGTPAVPIDQDEGMSARDEFYSKFASRSGAQVRGYWARLVFTGHGQPPRAVSNSMEVRKVVASNVQAIAYMERSAVDDSVRVLVEH